ncbi:hypothetical protein [Nitrosomonas sp. Nm166]|uniref:hypothetical protein n=1 Tax=Nitrosomonas sp. Nm166 TaxID=1881054 RepID=UPI0008F071AA|nr:hypothetical protein [Nitrosomonas sp. Nm166]SFF16754.1 hypothetical protein SAMN05428977_106113 [Nitrosomonas sp. Nm166]
MLPKDLTGGEGVTKTLMPSIDVIVFESETASIEDLDKLISSISDIEKNQRRKPMIIWLN